MYVAQFEKTIKEYSRQNELFSAGDKVLIALSGGADSVCLFLCLKHMAEELGIALAAAHVHHGIRKESADLDAAFCKELCEVQNVSFTLFKEDVPTFAKQAGLTEEEAGRVLRLRDLEQAAEREGCNKIAFAHHRDDQAETVLFRLFRGTGLTGAEGMRPLQGNRIRPLLCVSRGDIERYLAETGARWREDESNLSSEYTRNKIRLHILPYAEQEICNGAAEHLADFAEKAGEAEAFIRRQAEALLEEIGIRKEAGEICGFHVDKWTEADPFLGKQALLLLAEKTIPGRKDLGQVHVKAMERLLESEGNGKLSLPGGYICEKCFREFYIAAGGEREYEGDFLIGDEPPEVTFEIVEYDPSEQDFLRGDTYTKWLDYDTIIGAPFFRHKGPGDVISLGKGKGSKSLKKYFTEAKIPADCRDKVWVLADEKGVIWIPGGRISGDRKISDKTKRVLRIKRIK